MSQAKNNLDKSRFCPFQGKGHGQECTWGDLYFEEHLAIIIFSSPAVARIHDIDTDYKFVHFSVA